MAVEGIGARALRKEDKRFITGDGRYVDDVVRPNMTYAVFVRSPMAHGRIRSIDVAAAEAMPGVVGVVTGKDVDAANIGNLICGWAASYAHVWSSPASAIPSLGASGAIGGVLGAYVTLYPHARVVTLIPLGIFIQMVSIPAVFLLGFWFLQQFLLGATSLGATEPSGGVAWWAHIGGFAAGFVLVWVFQKRDRRPKQRDAWWQEPRWRDAPGRHRGW